MAGFHKISSECIFNITATGRVDGVRVMAKNSARKRMAKVVAASTLTQRDADKFKKSARKYTKEATTSKKKAQTKLISLGIYTPTGRLSKKYG
jgi:hypothetical protein